ncbi:MAG: CDP-alcohol phosphatidyltransferase family protein [Magnetococcales bacterium]|nr:CDP-alcohol phosphatidyltransferase family protein [Magnetococcales bacterium]
MNLPNALTLLRVFLVPAFIYEVMEDHYDMALWFFLVAAITDGLDGFIATRFNQRTEVGAYLDPLADKLLLMAGYLTLTYKGHMDYWLTMLVVGRDMLIVGGAILYQILTNALRMEPLMVSKVNTVMQIVLLVMVLFHLNHGWPLSTLVEITIILVVLTTVVSGVSYALVWTTRATHGRK